MTIPKVSVIVPVHNCRASVAETLRSVFEQTIAPELVEVVAVDDGSTDGSGDELDRLAAAEPRLAVVHQPNSGGPGGPRNTGIERARGEYLFFLDADDRLGPQALERMCALADEQGSDIVIGNYVGVGRGAARFAENIARVSVDDPEIDVFSQSLTAQKLFRRELVEANRIRFPEGLLSGEDKVFAVHAYLHASGVSVIADYDCYYLVERDDGTSIMQTGGASSADYYARAARPLLEMVVAHRRPGPIRDRMLLRLFTRDVLHRINAHRFLEDSAEYRRQTRDGVRGLCEDFLTPAVLMRMPPRLRLIAHCVRSGHDELLTRIVETALAPGPVPVVVDKDRAYEVYPGFREPSAAIPDAYFDVTDRLRTKRNLTGLGWEGGALRVAGTAVLARVDRDAQSLALLLRHRRSGAERRLPVEGGVDGFTAAVAVPAPGPVEGGAGASAAEGLLEAGIWDLYAEVTAGRLVKEGRLGADRAEGAALPPERFVASARGAAAVEPFFTREYGNLSFTVRPGAAGLARLAAVQEIGWDGDGRLLVRGRVPAAPGAHAHVRVGLALDRRGGGESLRGEARAAEDGDAVAFTASVDPRGLSSGRWDAWLELAVGGDTARVRVPIAEAGRSAAVACAPFGMRRARYYRTGSGNLAVEVVPGKVPAMARSARRRLGGRGRR
ncbi:glycosyltransferase [Actinomadura sp. LD22]|uniref:Glycosyltransferase n=1 Tax=Actinomadura physcomitrii TaxID=2650748 RepID=A0A6I4MNR8_9ACTN|nr:glycosyltransferase family 2 protein [Actinomadura physcomitrii]MWA05497.1 glycosyltransferase [Actinomadura physcomitrii]